MWQGQITCLALLPMYLLGQFLMQDSTTCPTPLASRFLRLQQNIWVGVSCGDILEYSCEGPHFCRDRVLGGQDVLVMPSHGQWFGGGCIECGLSAVSISYSPMYSSSISSSVVYGSSGWCCMNGSSAFKSMLRDMGQSSGCWCRVPEPVGVSDLSGIGETTSDVGQYRASEIGFNFQRTYQLHMVTQLLSSICTWYCMLSSTSTILLVFAHWCEQGPPWFSIWRHSPTSSS